MQCLPLENGSLFRGIVDIGIFMLATMSATVFYAASQQVIAGNWRLATKYMPLMMALGIGLCASNTKAVFEELGY